MTPASNTPISPEQALVDEREHLMAALELRLNDHANAAKAAERANARSFRLYEECKAIEERLNAINRALGVLA